MTNQQHPLTPPPELVKQLARSGGYHVAPSWLVDILTASYQAGADQELEACCEWIREQGYHLSVPRDLHADRRPKPPSLKERALLAIDTAVADDRLSADVANVVRRALEALPE